MSFSVEYFDYKDTKMFSALATDYVAGHDNLRPYYRNEPNLEGIKLAIAERAKHFINRKLLTDQLKLQYSGKQLHEKLAANLRHLEQENSFTITTAHQPNIFTGHLYFIYKIIHAIKLADELKQEMPEYNFVPVYYMGSEDADLDELGTITVNGKIYKWKTAQTGAVGRMLIDKAFLKIIQGLEAQLNVEPFGEAIMQQVKLAYSAGKTIEQASFDFVHSLFGQYGLLVLLPDNRPLKQQFVPIVQKDIFEQFSHNVLSETIAGFPEKYKIQANGRPINFFYLKDDQRERIVVEADKFLVENSNFIFSHDEMKQEIAEYPERFSANVILRPLYQEMLLPNIAFIGGGGELAYWLELKNVFEAAEIPYPVLVLRNSFSIIHKKTAASIKKLDLATIDFFDEDHSIIGKIVKRDSNKRLSLAEEKFNLLKTYNQIRTIATEADKTLERHVWSLQSEAVTKIVQLEKKMLRSAKKDFEHQKNRISKIKAQLFPGSVLQERVENILALYADYGPSFFDVIYKYSKGLDQQYGILKYESGHIKAKKK